MNTSSKWVLLSFAMGTGWEREVQEPALGLSGRRKEAWHRGGHMAPRLLLVLSVLPGRGMWVRLFMRMLLMFYWQQHLPLQGRLLVSF